MSFYSSLAYRYRPAISEVCEIVRENYYDVGATENFALACKKAERDFPRFLNARDTVHLINDLLSYIQTSHLALFDPEENTKLWFHESLDNGIRARDINGFVIVYEVLAKSSAEKAGIKIGDEILTIDQNEIRGSTELTGRSGDFVVVRNEHTQSIKVIAEKYEEDESLKIIEIDKTHAVLRVKSFLSPFFETEKLLPIVKELRGFSNVIIDLRGNIGGSFPAMMRLLSIFTCEPTLVGKLLVSEQHQTREEDLKDNLDIESQISQIEKVQTLNLRTLKPSVCLRDNLLVLIDHGTASVSEIFADGLKQAGRAEVLGQSSAGEVVMAKWFSIVSLGASSEGSAFSLSVPIANFENSKLQKLEDVGIRPDIYLEYSFENAIHGVDSWIDEILKLRHK